MTSSPPAFTPGAPPDPDPDPTTLDVLVPVPAVAVPDVPPSFSIKTESTNWPSRLYVKNEIDLDVSPRVASTIV